MPAKLDLTGQKFGRLTAIEATPRRKGANIVWSCICDCGKSPVYVDTCALRTGNTQSCGCLHADTVTRHGATRRGLRHPLYRVWHAMIDRCYNKNNKHYKDYGGRGIQVWHIWHVYENFRDYMLSLPDCPADAEKPNAHLPLSLDRYPDNDGPYKPGNVRWATDEEQGRNRRTSGLIKVNDTWMTLKEICRKYGKSDYSTIRSRIKSGWPIKKAVLTPPDSKFANNKSKRATKPIGSRQ